MPLVRRSDPIMAADGDVATAPAGPDAMLAVLHDGTSAQRRVAARDLACHPQTSAALARLLGDEADPGVRSIMLTALIAHRTDDAAAGLLTYLRSDDAALRNEVIEALRTMPDAVAPAVNAMLSDPDSDVRILTVNLLAVLAHPSVPRWLEHIARTDPHVNVCAAAIDALAEAGDTASLPALAAAAARFPDEPFIAFAARVAQNRIGRG